MVVACYSKLCFIASTLDVQYPGPRLVRHF